MTDWTHLPDHLDYNEIRGVDDDGSPVAYPEVFCTIPGCSFTDGTSWGDLGSAAHDVDYWNGVHPAHGPLTAEEDEPAP